MKYFFSKKTFTIGDSKIETNDVGIIIKEKEKYYKIFFLKLSKEHEMSIKDVERFDIAKTGNKYQKKVCDRCFKILDRNEFSDNRNKKGGAITPRPSCKSCRETKDGVKIPNKIKKEWRLNKPKDYSLYQCPICNKINIPGHKNIVADHNHQTGELRGYICESCNTGIGRFDDDPEIIKKTIEWLKNN